MGGGGGGVGGSEGGGDTGLEGAACVPGDASAKCARSSGNGGDLWVMLEECSVLRKRKEEHGRL